MTKLSLRMTKVAFLQSQLRRGVIMVKTTTPMMKKWTGQQAIDDNVPNLRAARTTDASTALIRRRLRNPGQSREGEALEAAAARPPGVANRVEFFSTYCGGTTTWVVVVDDSLVVINNITLRFMWMSEKQP
ncbi:hypothetical protein JTB14_002671 [Gonioctena quinquepunctata]|nr:hypothetical protein JTB14_002671 [Gonioctena quinquepunctata]